jgi:hypothetical protein
VAAIPGAAGMAPRAPAPVALASAATGLFVLQSDGQLIEFDTARQRVLRTLSVAKSAAYQTVDVASVQHADATFACMSVYSRARTEANSWVVQFTSPEPKWSWLPERGLYMGMAWLADMKDVLVVNSSTNSIYRVPFGTDQKARYFASVRGADRIGLLAHDTATESLLAVDIGKPAVWSLSLADKESRRLVTLDWSADLRASAWLQRQRRLYLADSAKEALWLVDLGSASPSVRRVDHARFRDPAGVAIAGGSLWVADEGARALFEMTLDGAVKREVAWPPTR